MECQNVFTRDPVFVHSTDSARTAAEKMRDHGVGFLPVCSTDKHVVGVLTDRDLVLRVVAEGQSPDTAVDSIASGDVVTCRATDSLEHCRMVLHTSGVARLVCVTDDGVLLGVLTQRDLRNLLPEESADTLKEMIVADRELV